MITRRRDDELSKRCEMLFEDAIQPIVRLFQRNSKWVRFIRVTESIRLAILQRKMAKRIGRMVRHYLVRVRVAHCIRIRYENREAERIKQLHIKACGIIGKYVRRRKELYGLKTRFHLRKLVRYGARL